MTTERHERDRLLRKAVLRGDQDAWQIWINETFDDLYRYVQWRCGGSKNMADEVVQEAWLTAARRLRKFDPAKGGFLSWMRGIAANVIRNQRRRDKRTESLNSDEIPIIDPDALADQERANRITTALCELPERHEAVLRAKYLEGHTVNEIAQLWNESPKAIESLLTRARQGFRDAFGQP